ncbi:MAG: hypothetical protein ACE5JL_13375, partial [Dehalococcoidia bacterium]
RLLTEHLTTVTDLCRHIREPTIFCGEMSEATMAAIKDGLGENALLADTQGLTQRAVYLAELGHAKIERGELDDPATLQPLYLRRPSITKPSKASKK